MTDQRLEQLHQWLKTVLAHDEFEITVASADASFRRYFRVRYDGISRIAMDAPPDKEDCRPYLKVAQAFFQMGMHVPEIYQQDLTQGFLLLSDFGSTCYLEKLSDESADHLYADAMNALLSLQTNPKPEGISFPEYDEALLRREMELFPEWFLGRHLGFSLSKRQRTLLDSVFNLLINEALQQDKVWVHRDYHSRNLMLIEEKNPGVIDFQDAVNGPVTYDLVSLLRDCYISWPQKRIESWVQHYLTQLQARGICSGISFDTFMRWFDLMGMQRHLKAIGIFARLNYRDNKPNYLPDVPRTLQYVEDVCKKYSELAGFAELVQQDIKPRMVA